MGKYNFKEGKLRNERSRQIDLDRVRNLNLNIMREAEETKRSSE